jgi:uncharacterized protein with HEPN domain
VFHFGTWRKQSVGFKSLRRIPHARLRLENVFMQSAVERQLGILGEAARRVSIEFQQLHPEIDWRNAINLRNILVHRYDQVSSEVIWNIVTSVLPSLLVQVEALLPPLPDDS